jgi:hypothetical protein
VLKDVRIPKVKARRAKAADVRALRSQWTLIAEKKMRSEALIRYGKAVGEIIGKEKLWRLLSLFVTRVGRQVAFVNDVLVRPKEGAIQAELEGLLRDLVIVRELGLPIDRQGIVRLAAALADEAVVEKLKWQKAPALAEAIAPLL